MSELNELTNNTVILTGASIPVTLPNKYFAIYYDKGFKGVILSQLGTSDSYIATPASAKDILKYYWSKLF